MSLLDAIRNVVGMISVSQKDNVITVSGVNGTHIYKDIKRIWGGNRLNDNLFIKLGANSFSFYSFFAPDILFTLRRIIREGKGHSKIRTLAKIRDALLEETWLANIDRPITSKLNYAHLDEFIYAPLDFQREFFETYDFITQQYNLNGFLFAGAIGSGKTLSSLMLAYCLEAEKIIVVGPKNAVFRVWEDTVKTKIKNSPTHFVSAKGGIPTNKDKVTIFHYEDLQKAIDYAKTINDQKIVLILDESHNFNTPDSIRTNLWIELCKVSKSKNIIELSGTPIKAMSKETIPLFRAIDPLFTPAVEESFKKIFRGDAGKAVDILNNRLGLVTFKVDKSQLNLTDPIFKSIYIKTPNANQFTLDAIKVKMSEFIKGQFEYYKTREKEDKAFFDECLEKYQNTISNKEQQAKFNYYKDCLKKIIRTNVYFEVKEEMIYCNRFESQEIMPILKSEEKYKFKEVKSIIKYLGLKIKGECLGRIVGGARIACHVDIAKYIDYASIIEATEKKTIVFTSYIDVLKEAEQACIIQDLKPVLVYGGTNAKLSNIIEEFASNDVLDPIIATYDSLSTAVPLVMCDTMLAINVPFRDYLFQQAVGRIHRIGADSQIYVYTSFLDTGEVPNISTRSKDILEWSQEEVNKIIGIKSPYILDSEKNDEFTIAVEAFKDYLSGDLVEKPIYLSW